MATEKINDFLLLHLPDNYRLEHTTDEEGKENYQILCDASQGSDGAWTAALTVKLQLPDKEGEIPEDKRNLNGNFHAGLSANIHEVPALLWTVNALVVALLLEHKRHTCVLACYETVRSRDELNDFAGRAAEHLNVLLGCVEIDGERGQMEPITPERLLELANVAEPLSEEAAQEEEKQRALEQFAQERPNGEGMSVRAVYRDPITGKVKRDLFWERAGAESGDPQAMIQMAMAYMNGDGVEQDAEKAAEYMQKAAELDDPTAQFNMGIYSLQGHGVARDFDRAYEWMQRAKENGDTDADGILDSIENVRALREKTEQGDLEAKVELAGTLMTMKGEENFRESVALAKEAAEAGSLKAMWIMGLAYAHGRGVEQNYEEAFRWYLKAAEAGHAPSQANLACLYARGDGVEKDMSKAEEWVRKSAAQGDPDGLRLLRNIDEQAAMDAERAAWEEKWRRQQEEEARKRAAEWMEKYGQYLEKDPRIVIHGSKFVFSGVMEDNWPDILQKLMDKGGVERGAVSGKTDYLVVDPRGFGESKVKEALAQRVKGKPVKIVLLEDFLKALGVKKEAAAEGPSASAPVQQEEEPAKEAASEKQEKTMDDKPITSMEEFRRFLQEHPDARITSVQQVSTDPITGKKTRTDLYGTPPTAGERNSAERRPSAKQMENRGFKDDIVAFMAPGMRYTAAELTAQVPSVVAAGLTQNRVVGYLTQLVSEGSVKKRTEGYTNYYSLPGSEAEKARLARVQAEEARRQEEERRKAEEARRQEEEHRKAEEARRQEEERKTEEARRQEEERKTEEARRREEERKAEEARKEEEQRRRAEEARQQEEERRRAEEARQQEERRRAEATAEQEASAREAQSHPDDPAGMRTAGVSKTVLFLAIALTLVTGILIGVLISHVMGGTREKESPANIAPAPQAAAGESVEKESVDAAVEPTVPQKPTGVSLPSQEQRLDTVIVDEDNMRPIFVDDEAVTVSLNSFAYANNETVYGLNILLKNRSDKTVSAVLTKVEIDGFEISTSQGKTTVSPGHSAVCYSSIWKDKIDEAGIQDWSELSGTILVREDYFGEALYSVPVVIKRSCWEREKTFQDTSYTPVPPAKAEAPENAVVLSLDNPTPLLLEQDGIRLSINSFSTANRGTVFEINFLLENGTEEDISVVLKDIVINGYEISASQGKTMVAAGKKAICDSNVWEKDLELAHIEEWTELQGTIVVRKDYFGEELYSIPVVIQKSVWTN